MLHLRALDTHSGSGNAARAVGAFQQLGAEGEGAVGVGRIAAGSPAVDVRVNLAAGELHPAALRAADRAAGAGGRDDGGLALHGQINSAT